MKSQNPNPKPQTNPKLQILIPPVTSVLTPKPKPYDIRERTFQFALRILDIAERLPSTAGGYAVRSQLCDAGTSVGANVEEADGAMTKADTRKSFVIARKEVREARYWLRIVDARWGQLVPVGADIQEATEILSILSSIILKLM